MTSSSRISKISSSERRHERRHVARAGAHRRLGGQAGRAGQPARAAGHDDVAGAELRAGRLARGHERVDAGGQQADVGRDRRIRRDADVDDDALAGGLLAGAIQWPGLAAGNVTVAVGDDRHARRLAGRGVDAARDVGGDDRPVERGDRLDRVGRGAARLALESRCRGSRRRRPRRRRARRGRTARGRRRGGAGSRRRRRRTRRARRAAARAPCGRAAQQARRDEAVAAVVALAADDRDRPARHEPVGVHGQAGAGALHEVQRRDALLLDRPAVGRPHLLGAEERLEPVGQRARGRGHPERTIATAPAVALGVRHRDVDLHAELAERAVQRDAGLRPLPDDLDVARVPGLQAQRLGDRLLGAEARREMLAGPRAAAAYARSPSVNSRSASPGRRSSACSMRSISSRSIPTAMRGRAYSTVTVLARLRGWSTFSPRLRAT